MLERPSQTPRRTPGVAGRGEIWGQGSIFTDDLMVWNFFFFGELFWQFWNWCFIVFLIYSEFFFWVTLIAGIESAKNGLDWIESHHLGDQYPEMWHQWHPNPGEVINQKAVIKMGNVQWPEEWWNGFSGGFNSFLSFGFLWGVCETWVCKRELGVFPSMIRTVVDH